MVHQPGLVVQGTSVKIAKWLTLRNFGYLLLTIQQWRVDGEIKGNTSVLKMHIYVTLSLCTKICVIVGSFPEMARTLEMFIFLKLNMLILDITYIYIEIVLNSINGFQLFVSWFSNIFLWGFHIHTLPS